MEALLVFVGLILMVMTIGTGLHSIAQLLSRISEALNFLAYHAGHSCDKCQAQAEIEDKSKKI